MDNILQKIDMTWTENTAVHKAYCISREEIAALMATMDALMKKPNKNITITIPPSLETMTSSTIIEEIIMQLSHIQHNIQDILNAIHNPPSKRK
jgi:hypothetical protein